MKRILFSVMMVLMLATSAFALELHEGVLGSYSYSYGTWNDRSTALAHFTPYGTATDSAGYIGDGAPTTEAARTTSSWLFATTSWSTCFMVKPNDLDDHANDPWYREGNPVSTHFKMYQNGNDAMYRYDDSFNTETCVLTGTAALSNNTWTQLCYTHGGGATKIYADGVEVASGCPNNIGVNGNSTITTNHPMDEFTAWDRTLTPTEVTTFYDATVTDQQRYPFVNCKINYNAFLQETGWELTRQQFRDFRRSCLLANRQERN